MVPPPELVPETVNIGGPLKLSLRSVADPPEIVADAVKFTSAPLHTVDEVGVMFTEVGTGLTVMVFVDVAVHPLMSVPVTVYVVLTVGVAVTEVPAEAFKLAAGAQV